MELRSELGVLKSTPSWRTGFMERLPTTVPRVVPFQERSRLTLRPPRKSALRARMLSTSGAPLCSVSSTV